MVPSEISAGLGLEPQKPRLKRFENRVGLTAAVLGFGTFWFSQPFLDGVAGQTGLSGNGPRPPRLADGKLFAEIHPPYLGVHDHGIHLLFAPA